MVRDARCKPKVQQVASAVLIYSRYLNIATLSAQTLYLILLLQDLKEPRPAVWPEGLDGGRSPRLEHVAPPCMGHTRVPVLFEQGGVPPAVAVVTL